MVPSDMVPSDMVPSDMAPSDGSGGGPSGFAEFFAADQRSLMRFCWGLTVDADVATDIAQEAMARAFERWAEVSEANPPAWVRTVALNLVRNRWRSRLRAERALGRLRSTSAPEDRGDPSTGTDVALGVAEALQALTVRQREAVVLHHMEDWPVAEVALAIGASEATVKTHLQRGREALRASLQASGLRESGPQAAGLQEPDESLPATSGGSRDGRRRS